MREDEAKKRSDRLISNSAELRSELEKALAKLDGYVEALEKEAEKLRKQGKPNDRPRFP